MVIEYENKKDEIIISNGTLDTSLYKNAYPIDINATFVMQEDIKDGKVRLRIGKVQNTTGIPALIEESKRTIFDQLTALVNDLQRYLLINDKKDDW